VTEASHGQHLVQVGRGADDLDPAAGPSSGQLQLGQHRDRVETSWVEPADVTHHEIGILARQKLADARRQPDRVGMLDRSLDDEVWRRGHGDMQSGASFRGLDLMTARGPQTERYGPHPVYRATEY
jgi:hypothetical protein